MCGDEADVVAIADYPDGDMKDALTGVGAVIHCAPLPPNSGNTGEHLASVVGSVMNILQQAEAAGIRKFVFTSNWITAIDLNDPPRFFSDFKYSENNWNPATLQQTLDGTRAGYWVTSAAATLAEKAVWKFARQHPDMDITTINPTYVVGPYPAGLKVQKIDFAQENGCRFARSVLMAPASQRTQPQPQPAPGQAPGRHVAAQCGEADTIPPVTVDVRDCARAHIAALRVGPMPPTPPAAESKFEFGSGASTPRKRFLVCGPRFSTQDALAHLAEARPTSLRGRLVPPPPVQHFTVASADTSLAAAMLGMHEYIDWKKTVEDTADNILELEADWD